MPSTTIRSTAAHQSSSVQSFSFVGYSQPVSLFFPEISRAFLVQHGIGHGGGNGVYDDDGVFTSTIAEPVSTFSVVGVFFRAMAATSMTTEFTGSFTVGFWNASGEIEYVHYSQTTFTYVPPPPPPPSPPAAPTVHTSSGEPIIPPAPPPLNGEGDDGASGHLYRVDISGTPFTAIGMPYLDTNRVYTDMHENRGIATGLRASVVKLVVHGTRSSSSSSSPIITNMLHAGYDVDDTSEINVQVSQRSLSALMTTCVPLTTRVEVSEDTLDDLTAINLVYRRSPIDCAMLEANVQAMGNPTVSGLFHDGGICDGSSGSKLTWLTPLDVASANSVATATNVRTTSGWYNIMQDYGANNDGWVALFRFSPCLFFSLLFYKMVILIQPPANSRYIMFNTGLPTTNTRFPLGALNALHNQGTTDMSTSYSTSRNLPFRASGQLLKNNVPLGGVPTCASSGSTACSVSIDRTALVPCTTVGATNWPECQKPTMWNFFPR